MMIRSLLTVVCISLLAPSSVMAAPNREIRDYAVAYRVQVYESFRRDRKEYDHRIAQGKQVLDMYRLSQSPGAKAELLKWYQQALDSSLQSSKQLLPTIPDISGFSPPAIVKQTKAAPRTRPTRNRPPQFAGNHPFSSPERDVEGVEGARERPSLGDDVPNQVPEGQSNGIFRSITDMIGFTSPGRRVKTRPPESRAELPKVESLPGPDDDSEPANDASQIDSVAAESTGRSELGSTLSASTVATGNSSDDLLPDDAEALAEPPASESEVAASGDSSESPLELAQAEIDDSEENDAFEMLSGSESESSETDIGRQLDPTETLELNARIAGHNLALTGLSGLVDQALAGDGTMLQSIVERLEVLSRTHLELTFCRENSPEGDKLIPLDGTETFVRTLHSRCRQFQPSAMADGKFAVSAEDLDDLRAQLDSMLSVYFPSR